MTALMQPLRKVQETRRAFDRVRRSTCANCPCGCGVKVFLREDALVDLFGDEEHPANKGSFCPKGLLAYRHLGHPDRLIWPQIRDRIAQPLRRVSWEEAIAFVARRLGEVAQPQGHEACSVHAAPASSFGHLLGGTMFAGGFGTPNGPWRFLPHQRADGGSLARMFGVSASRLLMNAPRDWCNSRCIVLYGCDPATTDPMAIGPIIDARDRGASVVVIDTRTTMTALKSPYALRVLPGTLSVALRGILRLLFERGLIDREFIGEATNGAQALSEELGSFPPDEVARRCGVDETQLRKIAEVIGTAYPVQVLAGGWLGMEELGDDDLRLCGALACLRGSIGIPGGGLNLLNATPFDPLEWLDGNARALAGGAALSLSEALLAGSRRDGAWFFEGDPIARLPGGTAALDSLSSAPLVVALGAYPSATTSLAHAVFPMASWLESDGLLANGNGRSLQWHSRILSPPGECRTALDFWTDLAGACGFGKRFPWIDRARGSRDRAAADWALYRNPWTRAVSVELLDPERNPPGGVLWPCTEASEIAFEESRFAQGDVRGRNILFQRNRAFPHCNARFPTSDGRITLPSSSRAPEVAGAQTGALWLVASLPVDHVENYAGFVSDRPAVPGAISISVHPRTAAQFSLKDGDRAVIENALGSLHGVVSMTETAAPDVVWCVAVPGRAVEGGDLSVRSPWSLFSVPRAGGPRASYALVKIRPDTDRAAREKRR